MNNISNRFTINVIDDGTSLHGNLVADNTMSQSWDGGSCSPSWATDMTTNPPTGTYRQPTIKMVLLNGTTIVPLSQITNVRWFYDDYGNEQQITFQEVDTTIQYLDKNNVQRTVTGKLSSDGKFLKCTSSVTKTDENNQTEVVQVPALRIVQNLASSTNKDLDTITMRGEYNTGNGGVEFSAAIQVRITEYSPGGYNGTIYGVTSITEKNQVVELFGELSGSQVDSGTQYSTMWYVNESQQGISGGNSNTFQISEGQVEGKAVIRCEFIVNNEVVAVAYAEVDDMYDNEDIQFWFDGERTNHTSMRSSDSHILVKMWVADNNTPDVVDASWNLFKVQLIDGDKKVIMQDPLANQIPMPDQNGLRTLPRYTGDVPQADLNKAYIDVAFSTVKDYAKKNLSIIAYAYQTNN